MSLHEETPIKAHSPSSSFSSPSQQSLSTLPGAVETPLLAYLGVDLETWEARFKNLSAQSRDVLLVYLQVNYENHVQFMTGQSSEGEKRKRDAEVKDVLHLYIQTFVCLSVVFPSVFSNTDHSMAILDSLQEIDVLILRSMADGTALSLDQIFPIALKPDKSGINLRAMSKEKNMPIRKNPLVMCFEGALIYLAILRGRYEHLLTLELPAFLELYPEFNYSKSFNERYELSQVKADEKDKFCKTLSESEVNLLFRCYNMMVVSVEMTNDKAFKCCELSVRLIEGESGQGFKPGGDNGPRILHRMHLHSKLVKAKRKRPVLSPVNLNKRDRNGLTYLDILSGAIIQDQNEDKREKRSSKRPSKSKFEGSEKEGSPSSTKKSSLKKKYEEKESRNKKSSSTKKDKKEILLNLASVVPDQQPIGNLEFLNQLAEVAGALHSEESNTRSRGSGKKGQKSNSDSGSISMSMPPLMSHMSVAKAMQGMPIPMTMPMTMPMPMHGIAPLSAMQMQMHMPPIPLHMPPLPMHLSMPNMSNMPNMPSMPNMPNMPNTLNMPTMPNTVNMPDTQSMPPTSSKPSTATPTTTSEFFVPIQFAEAFDGLNNYHQNQKNELSRIEIEDANSTGGAESQELSQVSIESDISEYNDQFK